MIGAVVYELRAVNGGRVPVAHGRLLHAALFALLRSYSPALAERVHNEMNLKPFTVAELELPRGCQKIGNSWQLKIGDIVYWRVTALEEAILAALISAPPGESLQVGQLTLLLDRVIADSEERSDAGVLDLQALLGACLAEPAVKSITFHFRSPVSFRSYDKDFPFPLPDLIFSSLADKWNQCATAPKIDKGDVQRMAAALLPLEWQGATRRVNFGRERSVLAFEGTFSFAMRGLAREEQRILLLLAQFAVFSGVGRLTAQGLGQTRITYR